VIQAMNLKLYTEVSLTSEFVFRTYNVNRTFGLEKTDLCWNNRELRVIELAMKDKPDVIALQELRNSMEHILC